MTKSEEIPAGDVQRFFNRLANSDIGAIGLDPIGRTVYKLSHNRVSIGLNEYTIAEYESDLRRKIDSAPEGFTVSARDDGSEDGGQ